jgi:hypothetical protein
MKADKVYTCSGTRMKISMLLWMYKLARPFKKQLCTTRETWRSQSLIDGFPDSDLGQMLYVQCFYVDIQINESHNVEKTT